MPSGNIFVNHVIFILLSIKALFCQQEIDPRQSLVFGPGLDSSFNIPARYFIVQAVDEEGKNVTYSIGKNAFKAELIQSRTSEVIRSWVQVLDRKDGSYLIRYRLYESYNDVKIKLTYHGIPVGKSPYLLKGNLFHEDCYCPERNIEKWLKSMKCPKSYGQIKKDLSIFKDIDFQVVNKEIRSRFDQPGSVALTHYSIVDNKIYRRTQGEHVGFKMFSDAILLSLSRKVRLPDMELIINLGDWPLEQRKIKDKPLPIFSWCGSESTRDIVMPTYELTEAALESMGRVSLDMLSVQANTGPPWENKTAKGFWRGRDSREERITLLKLSREHPDLIDAAMTNIFFFNDRKDEIGELKKHISFYDFFKFKYQITIDGTVAAYRVPFLLFSDSLVFKQASPYYEHFYKLLKPFTHYIPVKRDLSDLIEKLKWAKENDEVAQEIAKNAQNFAKENLMANHIFCYHILLFQKYSKLLIRKPVIHDEMELVEHPNSNSESCRTICDNTEVHDEL